MSTADKAVAHRNGIARRAPCSVRGGRARLAVALNSWLLCTRSVRARDHTGVGTGSPGRVRKAAARGGRARVARSVTAGATHGVAHVVYFVPRLVGVVLAVHGTPHSLRRARAGARTARDGPCTLAAGAPTRARGSGVICKAKSRVLIRLPCCTTGWSARVRGPVVSGSVVHGIAMFVLRRGRKVCATGFGRGHTTPDSTEVKNRRSRSTVRRAGRCRPWGAPDGVATCVCCRVDGGRHAWPLRAAESTASRARKPDWPTRRETLRPPSPCGAVRAAGAESCASRSVLASFCICRSMSERYMTMLAFFSFRRVRGTCRQKINCQQGHDRGQTARFCGHDKQNA